MPAVAVSANTAPMELVGHVLDAIGEAGFLQEKTSENFSQRFVSGGSNQSTANTVLDGLIFKRMLRSNEMVKDGSRSFWKH